LAALAWSAVEPRWFALRHATLPVLRPGSPALRVLHLSDHHLTPGAVTRQRVFAERCRAAGADLVVATGDLMGTEGMVDATVDVLERARGNATGIAVLGSSDYLAPKAKNPARYLLPGKGRRIHGPELDTDNFVAALQARGWHVLVNARAAVTTPAGTLDVVGLDDPHIDLDEPLKVDWSPSAGNALLRLGAVHAPYLRCLCRFGAEEFDLVLSGHTHGGQLRMPGVGALTTNSDLPRRRARGASRDPHGPHGMWVHVSAGLGHSPYTPLRFACRPEASVLDLVARVHASG